MTHRRRTFTSRSGFVHSYSGSINASTGQPLDPFDSGSPTAGGDGDPTTNGLADPGAADLSNPAGFTDVPLVVPGGSTGGGGGGATNEQSTIYFGVSSTATADESLVLGLGSVFSQPDGATLTFPAATNEYLYWAVPSITVNDPYLLIDGFQVYFPFNVVVVNGSQYNVYRSEFLQNGDGIEGVIVDT